MYSQLLDWGYKGEKCEHWAYKEAITKNETDIPSAINAVESPSNSSARASQSEAIALQCPHLG